MLANMACSLIEHKRINTTVAKAKALKQFIEPLITKSKPENNVTSEKGTHNRRIVFKNLRDKQAVGELFGAVAEKVGDRPGGYTRIIKLGNRMGDNADMAMIELVDFNELYNAGKPKKKKSTRRGGSKKTETAAKPAAEAKAPAKKAGEAAPEAKAPAKEVKAPVAEAEQEVAQEMAAPVEAPAAEAEVAEAVAEPGVTEKEDKETSAETEAPATGKDTAEGEEEDDAKK
jgi:large subunit ribosomal protein L17